MPGAAVRCDKTRAPTHHPLQKVQVHPGEVLDLTYDSAIRVELLDVRSETDYNYFHIIDAQHVPLTEVPDVVPDLQAKPDNTVFVVMSNDETAATEAWSASTSAWAAWARRASGSV